MELVCVRHGRTAWNRDRRFQGHADIPLDDDGRAQARALAAYLAPERYDAAVSSDLSRALETAKAIGAACGVTVEAEPALREMRFGSWEGLTWEEIVARTPDLAYEYEKTPKAYAPPDGESFEILCARVAPVLAHIAERTPPDGRALVVSHAGVMHAILGLLCGDVNEARGVRLLPASIIRLRGSAFPYTIIALNEVAPLTLR
jgi:broad specificity phosphatase PhoE